MMTIETRVLRDLRIAAGGMLAVGLAWPLSPVHPPALCPLRSSTGVPCPFCGMTRSVVAALHGHLATSLRYNPGGVVVIALAVVVLLRPSLLTELGTRLRPSPWLLAPVFAALWVYNIGWNPLFT